MPDLAQNLGSWSATFVMFGLSYVIAWQMIGLGRRVGLPERRSQLCASLLGAACLVEALLPLRYAIQVLSPVPVLLLWLLTANKLAARAHRLRPALQWGALTLAFALAISLSVCTSVRTVTAADTLRHLSLDDVQRIQLQGPKGPLDRVVLASTYEVADVLEALAHSVPYTPNREPFEDPYAVTIQGHGGSLKFLLYRGRCGRAETAVLALQPAGGLPLVTAYYENQALYWLLVTNYRLPAWFPE